MDSQHHVGTDKLASGAAECAEGLTSWHVSHVRTYVPTHSKSLGLPVVLTHRAISLFPAQMPTEGSIVGLNEVSILIMRHNNAGGIRYICVIVQVAIIDGISM